MRSIFHWVLWGEAIFHWGVLSERNNKSTLRTLREEIKMFLHYGDMTDSSNPKRIWEKVQPGKIYPVS